MSRAPLDRDIKVISSSNARPQASRKNVRYVFRMIARLGLTKAAVTEGVRLGEELP